MKMLPLRIVLALLGVAAIGIAASILVLGAETTAATAERSFQAVTGYDGRPSGRWLPTMDSELRFYAALWGAYGIILVMTARRMSRYMVRVPWLAAVFFVGGVGRLVSYFQVGPPHPVFVFLMLTELLLPPAILLLWLGGRKTSTEGEDAPSQGQMAVDRLVGKGDVPITTGEITAMTRGEP